MSEMTVALALLQAMQSVSPAAEGWEIVKGAMLTLSTTAALATVRTVFKMRDDLRDVKTIVVGVDGKNGLRSASANHEYRIANIEERHSNLDAIAAFEKEQHDGPDRRHSNRRLRDQAFPNPLDKTSQ